MSAEARCKSCRYWAPYPTTGTGECRRHTPTVYFVNYGNPDDCGATTAWPTTGSHNWCGEYTEREPLGAAGLPWHGHRAVYFPSEVES